MLNAPMGGARKRKQHGGNSHGMPILSPANIDRNASDTNKFPLGAENYGRPPNMFSSNVNPANIVQGGGAGFGYTTGTNTNIYAGSYAPIDRNCTGCEVGERGGNNFISGGGRRSKMKHNRKGGSKKRGRKGGKNYTRKQKGCSSHGSNSKGGGKGKRKGKKHTKKML
jgi:hypothetical protein